MRTQISRHPQGLSLKLPPEYAEATGLREGDFVELELTSLGQLKLTPVNPIDFDKQAFLSTLASLHEGMPTTDAVVEQMRDAQEGS
jgi:antitoxin component of MazEF toxin-antitoxin module